MHLPLDKILLRKQAPDIGPGREDVLWTPNQRRGFMTSLGVHFTVGIICLWISHHAALGISGPLSLDIGIVGAPPGPLAPPPPAGDAKAAPQEQADDDADEPDPRQAISITDSAVKVNKEKPKKETDQERLDRMRKNLRRLTPVKRNTQALNSLNKTLDGMKTARIGEKVRNEAINASFAGGGGGGGGGNGGTANPYLTAVSALLHQLWDQPSSSEVGGGKPVVFARLVILPDGSVKIAALVKRSGNGAMDASVERLLRGLRVVPAYSKYGLTGSSVKIDIQFNLD